MAESSLFAQRLQVLMERRRLQERILATRRALEEERLKAQRLKRKSLRDRWLMEGLSAPTDDSDHVPSSVWEAQTRIQELEEDLSSLQSQMQQLDNPELHLRRQQPEDSVEAMKELKQSSPDGTGEASLTSSSSPEGRSSLGPRLELAPVPPKRAVRTAAKEKLQNGDMSGDGVFDSEYSPDKVNDKVNPVVVESGELLSHQEKPDAVPATKPTLQSPNPIDAPASHHRKLAVEEMVIRDHLGQEVGSMDAVGQKQSSITKEEECEEHTPLRNGCEEGSGLAPPHNGLGQEATPATSGSQLDGELGSRDGPEGESPTSQDEHQQNSSKPLQDETSCLDSSKQQADGELGKETALMGAEQKELPGQSANKVEPSQVTVASDALATESITSGQVTEEKKESQETEITVLGQGGERPENLQDPPKEPLIPDQTLPVHEVLEEATLSSSPSEQISMAIQKPGSSLQETEGSLLDQIPSSHQEMEGPLLEPVVLSLPNQSPSVFVNQNPPLQESELSLLAQISSSVQEPVLDPNPPSLQDSFSSSSEQKPSSLQGMASSLQEAKHSTLDQIPSPLHETNAKCLDQIPTSLQNTSVPDQTLPPPSDQFTSLPEDIKSSLHEISSQISSTLEGQEISVMEVKGSFPDITSSLPNPLSSLPDQVNSLQDAQQVTLEEISVDLQNQVPTPPVAQIPSLPEAVSIPQGQDPVSMSEDEHLIPKETPVPGPDQVLPVLQDQAIQSLEAKTLSSLPEVGGSFTEKSVEPLPSQTSPSLLEGRKSPPSEVQAEQMPTSAQGQPPSPVEATQTLSEKEIAPSVVEETPALPDRAPSPSQVSNTANVPDVLLSSSQEHAQSLLGKAASVANQELKEGGDASLASTTTEETPEVLGNLHAEQQPLLNKTNTSVAPPEISVDDQKQPKAGILKPQAIPSQETPTYTTSSANTASSCQLQSTGSRQEEGQDQGQSRRKQKSCQCCSVM